MQYDVLGLSAMHSPADDPVGIKFDDDREVRSPRTFGYR